MANATSVGFTVGSQRNATSFLPCVFEATTSEQSAILNPDLAYLLMHDGETTAAADDTNTIYLAFSGSTDADASEGADKAKLLGDPLRSFPIGPGLSIMKWKTAAGAPTFTVIAGPNFLGKF